MNNFVRVSFQTHVIISLEQMRHSVFFIYKMGIIIGPTCRGCCVWVKCLSKVTKVNHTHGHCTQKPKIKRMSFCVSPKSFLNIASSYRCICSIITVYLERVMTSKELCALQLSFSWICVSPHPQQPNQLLSTFCLYQIAYPGQFM